MLCVVCHWLTMAGIQTIETRDSLAKERGVGGEREKENILLTRCCDRMSCHQGPLIAQQLLLLLPSSSLSLSACGRERMIHNGCGSQRHLLHWKGTLVRKKMQRVGRFHSLLRSRTGMPAIRSIPQPEGAQREDRYELLSRHTGWLISG